MYTTLAGVQYVSSEIACGSNHSPPWKWGLGTDETWVKSLSLCGLWGLEGTRRYLSPSREVAAAIPRSQGGRATHAGVDRRWHAVCDTEGIDERHTGARLHGGTRDPRRGVTEGSSVSPASGNCSGTRGTSARHTGARAVFPGFKPLKPRYHVYPVGRRRTSHAQRRDQLGASLVPPTIFPKAPIECSHSAHSQEYFPFPCRSTRDGPAAREVFDTPTTVAAPARVHRNPPCPSPQHSQSLTILPSRIHRQNEPSPVGSTAHSPTSKSPFTEDRLASIVGKKMTLRRENSRGSAGSLAALGMSDASASTSPYGSAAPSRRASVGDLASSLGGGVDSGRLSPLSADGRVSPTGADSDADVTMNDIVDDRGGLRWDARVGRRP